ncbi:MAG: hypothetical protein APF76_08940 [Desulfitibacter sp. BRH_c19]|nr:MAG: hypothetical protein APF76_08940 [Desulfitibacter sp. BRH_c19]
MKTNQRQMHNAFWAGEEMSRPLFGFSLGPYFPAKRYSGAENLLVDGLRITPEMIVVEDFFNDYERMYQETMEVQQDLTLVASPFTGIPWMEAMLGCEIFGGNSSFIAEARDLDWADIGEIAFNSANPWVLKYMEFIEKLINLSQGRFPIGQPILRGPSDMMSCLRGHQQFAIDYILYPEEALELQDKVTKLFVEFIRLQQKRIECFAGGTGFGFYSLWSPGKAIWFQEDACALLSPKLYSQYLKKANKEISAIYPNSLIHLHPASLFALDEILSIELLKVIQINKDVGGPTITELIPYFKKVVDRGKKLVVWGDLSLEEVHEICTQVPIRGVCLHIVAEDKNMAIDISEFIRSRE